MGPARTYRNESWLREHYVDNGLSIRDIANKLGVAPVTIYRWLNKHDIKHRHGKGGDPTRGGSDSPATYHDDGYGYMYWTCGMCSKKVAVHRLVAVAEHGFDAVAGNEVHHKNGIKWDNRPSNLEVLGKGEHSALHEKEKRGDNDGYTDEVELRRLYEERYLSIQEIADSFEVDYETIRYWLVRHDIDRRPQHIINPRQE